MTDDHPRDSGADEPTSRLEPPARDEPTDRTERPALDEPTSRIDRPAGDEPTSRIERPAGDEPTSRIERTAGDEPADRLAHDEPTSRIDRPAYDEPTARFERPAASSEPTTGVNRPEHDEPTTRIERPHGSSDPTAAIPAQPAPATPEAARPARRPMPGRTPPTRPTPPAHPAAQAEPPAEQRANGLPAEADEETVRLTPLTDGATGEPSPQRPTAGDAPETRPQPDRSTGATAAPSRVSDVDEEPDAEPAAGRRKKRGTAGVIILVLLALLGFTLAVQLRGKSVDSDLAAMREDDLVRLQSDLQAQEDRLQREIASLQDSQRQLQSGAQGRAAALEEATKRADELAILAGTAPAAGPGLAIRFIAGPQPIAASDILNAVQELRGADAEAMQIAGAGGAPVRIVASTYFIDVDGGLEVSGKRLTGPYTITVIGDPPTMRTALNIPDGLVPSIKADGGNVIVDEHDTVDVTAVAAPVDLKHAKPVS